jgi:hypothetical protein
MVSEILDLPTKVTKVDLLITLHNPLPKWEEVGSLEFLNRDLLLHML